MCLNGTANRYGIVPVTERPNDTFDPVYERTVHGASETVRLPFSIAVLADLGDRYPLSLSDRRLIKLDVENFHRVLAHLTPEIQFQVDSPDSELPDFKIPCQLQFRSLDDFDPYSVIEQVDVLRALSRNEELSFGIDFRDLLASVIDHEKFQKASSIWHALFDFVSMIQKNEYCDVYVLNVSKRRVFKDLTKSVELDQTTLFKRLCLEQMGTAGGAPIGLVIADFSVGSHPDDLELIQKLSAVCAAGHMALLTEAREDLVFCNAWDDLDREFDPEWLVNFSRLEKFGSLRQREDAGSLALCAPGLRYRIPSPSSPPLHGSVAPWVPPLVRDVARKIRINPAYAVAAKVARQFHGSGRHASVSGELTWQHMPHTPGADSGEGEGRTPSMVALEAEGHFDAAIAAKLQRLGVNAVITDSGACTLHLPRIRTARDFRGPLDGPPAESNPSADLGARLYADRIIHYLSAFERDHLRDLPLERWHTTAMQYLTEYFYLPSETDDRDVGRRLGKISIALTPRAPWLRSCQKKYDYKVDLLSNIENSHICLAFSSPELNVYDELYNSQYKNVVKNRLDILSVAWISNSNKIGNLRVRKIINGYHDNVDAIINRLEVTTPHLVEPIKGVEDFAPEELVERIGSSAPGVSQRRTLSDLAAVVDIDASRKTDFDRFVRSPEGPLSLWDLIYASVSWGAVADSPVDPAIVEEALGGCMLASNVDPDFYRAMLTTLSAAMRERPACIRESWPATLRSLLDAIDEEFSGMVEPFVHDPTFRKFQSSWRGFQFLAEATDRDETTQAAILPLTAEEIGDLDGNVKDLCELIGDRYAFYSDTGDFVPRGPSRIVFDLEIEPNGHGFKRLQALSQICGTLSTRVLVGASPSFLGASCWDDITDSRGRAAHFEPEAVAMWRRFRRLPHAECVTMVLPPFLSERRALPKPTLATFRYRDAGNTLAQRPVRSNGAYVYAAEMALAHNRERIPDEDDRHLRRVMAAERDGETLFGPILPALIDGLDPLLRSEGIVWPLSANPPYFIDVGTVASAPSDDEDRHAEIA